MNNSTDPTGTYWSHPLISLPDVDRQDVGDSSPSTLLLQCHITTSLHAPLSSLYHPHLLPLGLRVLRESMESMASEKYTHSDSRVVFFLRSWDLRAYSLVSLDTGPSLKLIGESLRILSLTIAITLKFVCIFRCHYFNFVSFFSFQFASFLLHCKLHRTLKKFNQWHYIEFEGHLLNSTTIGIIYLGIKLLGIYFVIFGYL